MEKPKSINRIDMYLVRGDGEYIKVDDVTNMTHDFTVFQWADFLCKLRDALDKCGQYSHFTFDWSPKCLKT